MPHPVRKEDYVQGLAVDVSQQVLPLLGDDCTTVDASRESDEVDDPRSGWRTDSREGSDLDRDIVQFSSPMFYVEADEGLFTVGLMRLGKAEGPVSVRYHTLDASATSGHQYVHTEGIITFEDGEETQSIDITIINDPNWNPTLEFKLSLTDPKGCELEKYLKTARVKVIDKTPFPTYKYASNIAQGMEGLNKINSVGLFLEYVRFVASRKGMLWRSVFTIAGDQMRNLYLLLNLFIKIYMVDVLFKDSAAEDNHLLVPGNRPATAAVLGGLIVGPMVVLHLWDIVKVKLDLVGMISVVLQTSVFAKYLNYSEESREVVSGAQLTIATTQDCQALANGYTSALAMVEVTVRVVVLACFALKQNPGAWWAVAAMPAIMLVVTACRMPIVLKVNADVGEYASDFHAYVAETVANYSVVQDYFQRPRMNEHYQRKSEALRVNQIPATMVEVNNKYCPKWLGPVFVGLYIAFESDAVFTGELSLGKFLATVSILTDMAQDFAGIYELLMMISGTFDEVKSVVEILNMKTDVPSWLNVSRKRLNWTNQSRKTIKLTKGSANGLAHWAQNLDSKFPRPEPNAVDTIVFELHDVCFHYNESPVLFQGVNLSTEQGNLVAYRAPLGTGLGTFMELLAHKKFPTSGTIFFPAHLRILFVSQEVYILSLSCWDNLTFGVEEDDQDPNVIDYILKEMHMEKTRALCKDKLRAFSKQKPSVSTEHARADECQHETEEEALGRLNNTERAKIHLARAFIMNPEVMVLNRPCCHCDSQTVETSNTLRLMREMVDTRGVGLSPATIHRRRPRTAFFTPETDSQAEIADIVWEYDTATRTINARSPSARKNINARSPSNEGYRAERRESNASYGGNDNMSRRVSHGAM